MDDSIVSSAYRGLPIVFLGPSIALDEARAIVNADFRPPCRRGDLAKVVGGAIIGLIDGVFDQNQAVSPREIVYALKRGVTIFGSSSMGALRAVEIPGMHGVGHIYEMYRKGIIDGDDEVALIFDPSRFVPLTVPLVNVRYAIERLLHSGSISASVSERILAAAKKLHYRDRTYKRILAEAKLDEKIDTEDLLNLLTRLDLKREDAKLLLERLADVQHLPTSRATPGAIDGAGTAPDYGPRDNFSSIKAPVEISVDAPVLIWEMGDAIPFAELVLFLKLTGRYMLHARNAIIRLLPQNQSAAFPIEVEPRRPQQNLEEVKRDFRRLCATWGWKTREEIQVTMSDLGLGLKDISTQLRDEGVMQRIALRLACNPTPAYMKALRCELFFNDMALKREAMRYASLKKLVGKETPSDEATDSAKRILCRLHCMPNWYQVQKHLIDMGAAKHEIQHFLEMITNARLMVEAQQPAISMADQNQKVGQAADEAFGLRSSPKAPGDQRFCLPLARAYEQVNRLKTLIGITRVGMIAGLTELEGVHISQAARPDGAWSSSYGSGKSDTKEGAVIGGIMEEVEKWAQERYKGEPIWTSYANLRGENALDPRMLDL